MQLRNAEEGNKDSGLTARMISLASRNPSLQTHLLGLVDDIWRSLPEPLSFEIHISFMKAFGTGIRRTTVFQYSLLFEAEQRRRNSRLAEEVAGLQKRVTTQNAQVLEESKLTANLASLLKNFTRNAGSLSEIISHIQNKLASTPMQQMRIPRKPVLSNLPIPYPTTRRRRSSLQPARISKSTDFSTSK